LSGGFEEYLIGIDWSLIWHVGRAGFSFPLFRVQLFFFFFALPGGTQSLLLRRGWAVKEILGARVGRKEEAFRWLAMRESYTESLYPWPMDSLQMVHTHKSREA